MRWPSYNSIFDWRKLSYVGMGWTNCINGSVLLVMTLLDAFNLPKSSKIFLCVMHNQIRGSIICYYITK